MSVPGDSRPRRSPAQRAAVVSLSAAAVIVLAGCSSGSKSASTPLTPGQALLAAATQAQQVTSATETLNVDVSGASTSTTSGTIQIRLKPTLLASESLNQAAGGANTRIKVQSNNFAGSAKLVTVAKNTRVAGTQTIDGTTTTEYAGSFTAADGLKALPASLRELLGPGLQALGNGTIYFRAWIDGQHNLRKITDIETVNGDTITTTISVTKINQPVSVTLPPASQTLAMPESSVVSGKPVNVDLRAKVVPAPPGFALSQDPNEHSGPMSAAGFNSYMGGNLAAELHFVRGYDVFYDSPDGDIIEVTLFQFATQNDATLFKAGWVPGGPVNAKADPVIPRAEDFDSTKVDQDSADHGVIAIKGNVAFVIDDTTSSTAPVPQVETMARQQYAAL